MVHMMPANVAFCLALVSSVICCTCSTLRGLPMCFHAVVHGVPQAVHVSRRRNEAMQRGYAARMLKRHAWAAAAHRVSQLTRLQLLRPEPFLQRVHG